MSEEKKELRKKILKQRDEMAFEQRDNDSAIIRDMVFLDPCVLTAKRLLIFASFGSEPDTDIIAEKAFNMGKEIFYPRVEDKEIRFYQTDDISGLKPGYRNIREPEPERPWNGEEKDTVILVPGTAFDTEGRRLGYGGGFYDRFLKAHPSMYRIGICFPFQILESIPAEEHDERVDLVIWRE